MTEVVMSVRDLIAAAEFLIFATAGAVWVWDYIVRGKK